MPNQTLVLFIQPPLSGPTLVGARLCLARHLGLEIRNRLGAGWTAGQKPAAVVGQDAAALDASCPDTGLKPSKRTRRCPVWPGQTLSETHRWPETAGMWPCGISILGVYVSWRILTLSRLDDTSKLVSAERGFDPQTFGL